MSGLEALGVVGTAAALVDLTFNLCKHLDAFARRANEAEAYAKDLHFKVNQVRTCSQTVQRACRSRMRQVGPEEQDPEEEEVWTTISKTLVGCERVLRKFQEALKGLARNQIQYGWLGKALLQHRIEQRGPRLQRLERKIDLHLATLNISILSVHFIVHLSHHTELTSMFSNGQTAIMDLLGRSLQTGSTQLAQPVELEAPTYHRSSTTHQFTFDGDSAIEITDEDIECGDPAEDLSNLKMAIDAGRQIKARSESRRWQGTDEQSVYSGSNRTFASSADGPNSSISFESRSQGMRSDVSRAAGIDFPEDPTPYFDDTTPREVLDAVVRRLMAEVRSNRDGHRFQLAEQQLLEAIECREELYIAYGVPFNDFMELQNQLASIYFEQDKLQEAGELTNLCLQGKIRPGATNAVKAPTIVNSGVMPENVGLHYRLAKINQKKYVERKYRLPGPHNRDLFLIAAERDAKRAFKCRMAKPDGFDPTLLQTAKLLIEVYDEMQKPSHAAAYRELYLKPVEFSEQPLPEFVRSPATNEPTSREMSSPVPPPTSGTQSPRGLDLISAIIAGRDGATIDELIAEADLNARRWDKTASMYAVEMENELAIRKLHEAGANLNEALFHAVKSDRIEMTRLLLRLSGRPEPRDAKGASPLLAACKTANADMVKMLLEEKSDVYAVNKDSWSVLHVAVHHGGVRVVQLLLDPRYQVNKDAQCSEGKTALHYMAERRESTKLTAVLLNAQVDPQVKDDTNRTPLHLGISRRNYNFVKMLVEANVALDCTVPLPATNQEIKNLLAGARRTPSFAPSIPGQSPSMSPQPLTPLSPPTSPGPTPSIFSRRSSSSTTTASLMHKPSSRMGALRGMGRLLRSNTKGSSEADASSVSPSPYEKS